MSSVFFILNVLCRFPLLLFGLLFFIYSCMLARLDPKLLRLLCPFEGVKDYLPKGSSSSEFIDELISEAVFLLSLLRCIPGMVRD